MELKWAWRTAQPSMGKRGNVPSVGVLEQRWEGRCHPSPPMAAGWVYLCFMEFPKSRRGICGDQRGTDSVSAGRDRKTSTGDNTESWHSGSLGRGAKDVPKKWDFPAICPWNASLSSLFEKQETFGLCGSVRIGVSCPRSHHPV